MARPNQNTHSLSLTVPDDVYRLLIKEASKEQRSLSNMTAILLREAFNARKGGKGE